VTAQDCRPIDGYYCCFPLSAGQTFSAGQELENASQLMTEKLRWTTNIQNTLVTVAILQNVKHFNISTNYSNKRMQHLTTTTTSCFRLLANISAFTPLQTGLSL